MLLRGSNNLESPPPSPDWVNDDGTLNPSTGLAEMSPPPPGPGSPDLTLWRRLEVGDEGELTEVVKLSDDDEDRTVDEE